MFSRVHICLLVLVGIASHQSFISSTSAAAASQQHASDSLYISRKEKLELKEKVLKMFDHAFQSYMKYAYPADELMPLSCKGRYRNSELSRGDVDEALGNYTLTLVDSLDTLAVLGRIDDFEQAVINVIAHTNFDSDVIVSVFETNIRMLGGLLSGHVALIYLRNKQRQYAKRFEWYDDELLKMARDLGHRLLPAFNTSTGLPMSRINLKRGITQELTDKDKFTCTACAGTLLLEFVMLSRLTNESIFEEKVVKTMDILWEKRNRLSDLVGTVISVSDGSWTNTDASIGAGIDSYYEYLFKGYILMGDEELLHRFNRHYDAITKYMSLSTDLNSESGDGSCMKTVHMHMPHRQARNYIDALLAFWPGIQVMKGDIKSAIKMHENLHQIVKKHDFLPEAVLFDYSVHWSSHPLRPEFLESTYYLYKATNDNYYLQVAKNMLEQLEKHSRVKCGYAAFADVKTKRHEDRIDSFVYAETFKYFYLMFAEDDEMLFDMNDFLFSTEAHLLPLHMKTYSLDSRVDYKYQPSALKLIEKRAADELSAELSTSDSLRHKLCPSLKVIFATAASTSSSSSSSNKSNKITTNVSREISDLRDSITQSYEKKCKLQQQQQQSQQQQQQFNYQREPLNADMKIKNFNSLINNMEKMKSVPLRAVDFVVGRQDHLDVLKQMGVRVSTMNDGKIQLMHSSSDASTPDLAEMGILFMTEMLELTKQKTFQLKSTTSSSSASGSSQHDEFRSMSIVLVSAPFNGSLDLMAGPAQFGYDLRSNYGVFGKLLRAEPFDACSAFTLEANAATIGNKIIVAKRGGCTFVEKARRAQRAGALGLIVLDNSDESSFSTSVLFAMSGDDSTRHGDNVTIPCVFLFGKEGNELLRRHADNNDLLVFVGEEPRKLLKHGMNSLEMALNYNTPQIRRVFTTSTDGDICLNKRSKSSSRVKAFLTQKSNKNRLPPTQCRLKDYELMKFYYEILSKP